jgi:poly(hydroxyalkanoate) granule-associated protein
MRHGAKGNQMAAKRKSRGKVGRTPATAQERLLDTVHQIWLAGLGAVSKARQGTPQLLEDLVSEGARIHTETRGAAEKAVRSLLEGVQTSISTRVGQVQGQAADTLANLEKIFQTRVHRALTQLGVPSAEEVESLSKRVDALNANIDKLTRARKVNTKARGSAGRRSQTHSSASAS